MKTIFALLLIFTIPVMLFGQYQGDSISKDYYYKNNGKAKMGYYLGDRVVKKQEVLEAMKVNPDAYQLFSKGNSQSGGGTFLMITGSAVSLTAGIILMGKDKTSQGLLVEVGGILVSVAISWPFWMAGYRNKKAGIDLYNALLLPPEEVHKNDLKLNFGTTANGIGFTIAF